MPGLVTLGLGVAGGLVTDGLGGSMYPPNHYDLITYDYAVAMLAAGGITLDSSQQAVLPNLITAASLEFIRYTNRTFVLTPYNEILIPEGTRQDRGEPQSCSLTYFPVQYVNGVFVGRQTALQIQNTDNTNNQWATVQFQIVGDVQYADLQYTGVVLNWLRLGSLKSQYLPYAAYLTVNALATAINALGEGWQATVTTGASTNIGYWPSTDLVGGREPKNALGIGANLDLFTQPANGFDIDRPTGILRVWGGPGTYDFGGAWGGGWGDPWSNTYDGMGYGGAGWNGQWLIKYQGGFQTIPADISLCCLETVKAALNRLNTDYVLKSETAKDYSYAIRDAWDLIPDWVRTSLDRYKNWQV